MRFKNIKINKKVKIYDLLDKRIYFAFQSDNTKYYKPSYDIDYENKIYGDEIIYIE